MPVAHSLSPRPSYFRRSRLPPPPCVRCVYPPTEVLYATNFGSEGEESGDASAGLVRGNPNRLSVLPPHSSLTHFCRSLCHRCAATASPCCSTQPWASSPARYRALPCLALPCPALPCFFPASRIQHHSAALVAPVQCPLSTCRVHEVNVLTPPPSSSLLLPPSLPGGRRLRRPRQHPGRRRGPRHLRALPAQRPRRLAARHPRGGGGGRGRHPAAPGHQVIGSLFRLDPIYLGPYLDTCVGPYLSCCARPPGNMIPT